jgi:hypothetical protein
MKVKDIKYTSKANSTAPVKGPKPNDAKLKPVNEAGPIQPIGQIAGVIGDKVTIAKPDGSKVEVDKSALIPSANGAVQLNTQLPADGTAVGTKVMGAAPNATPSMEEEGKGDIGGDATDKYVADISDTDFGKAKRIPREWHEQKQPSADDELLEKMRTIAGLR